MSELWTDDTEYTFEPVIMPPNCKGRIVISSVERYDDLQKRIADLEAQLAAATRCKHAPVKYNDVINDDISVQVRVVIDQSGEDKRTHLHIRKRVLGDWAHVALATVADGYAVCRLVEVTPVDMPDSPGWWAFEGRYGSNTVPIKRAWEVTEIRRDTILVGVDRVLFLNECFGKWWKLTMPWEANND